MWRFSPLTMALWQVLIWGVALVIALWLLGRSYTTSTLMVTGGGVLWMQSLLWTLYASGYSLLVRRSKKKAVLYYGLKWGVFLGGVAVAFAWEFFHLQSRVLVVGMLCGGCAFGGVMAACIARQRLSPGADTPETSPTS